MVHDCSVELLKGGHQPGTASPKYWSSIVHRAQKDQARCCEEKAATTWTILIICTLNTTAEITPALDPNLMLHNPKRTTSSPDTPAVEGVHRPLYYMTSTSISHGSDHIVTANWKPSPAITVVPYISTCPVQTSPIPPPITFMFPKLNDIFLKSCLPLPMPQTSRI